MPKSKASFPAWYTAAGCARQERGGGLTLWTEGRRCTRNTPRVIPLAGNIREAVQVQCVRAWNQSVFVVRRTSRQDASSALTGPPTTSGSSAMHSLSSARQAPSLNRALECAPRYVLSSCASIADRKMSDTHASQT